MVKCLNLCLFLDSQPVLAQKCLFIRTCSAFVNPIPYYARAIKECTISFSEVTRRLSCKARGLRNDGIEIQDIGPHCKSYSFGHTEYGIEHTIMLDSSALQIAISLSICIRFCIMCHCAPSLSCQPVNPGSTVSPIITSSSFPSRAAPWKALGAGSVQPGANAAADTLVQRRRAGSK